MYAGFVTLVVKVNRDLLNCGQSENSAKGGTYIGEKKSVSYVQAMHMHSHVLLHCMKYGAGRQGRKTDCCRQNDSQW